MIYTVPGTEEPLSEGRSPSEGWQLSGTGVGRDDPGLFPHLYDGNLPALQGCREVAQGFVIYLQVFGILAP